MSAARQVDAFQDTWDAPPSSKRRNRSPLMMAAGLGVVLFIIVTVALALATNNPSLPVVGDATDEATGEAVAVTVSKPILLVYDEFSFTVINIGESDAALTRITFQRADQSITEIGASVRGGSLPPGTCFRIRAQDRQTAIPSQCVELRNEVTRPTGEAPLYFWRSTSAVNMFTVLIDGLPVGECPSVERSQSHSCEIAFSS